MLQAILPLAVLAVGAPPDPYFFDPHPMRTLFRGPVLRLLDDPTTRLSLGLSSQQSVGLVEFQRDLDRKQDEFFTKTEDDVRRRLDMLQTNAEDRQRRFLADFERSVGQPARRKLV